METNTKPRYICRFKDKNDCISYEWKEVNKETKKMTLDEAIEHLEDTIKNKEFSCEACRDDHKQLLEWLKELRVFKEEKEKKLLYANYPFDM